MSWIFFIVGYFLGGWEDQRQNLLSATIATWLNKYLSDKKTIWLSLTETSTPKKYPDIIIFVS